MEQKISIEKMIRTQFRKAKNKSYSDNFRFESENDDENIDNSCIVRGILPQMEKCIVRIYATDLTSYHLTNRRIFLESEGLREIVKYEDIVRLHWQSKDIPKTPQEATKLKSHNYDSFVVRTNDGNEIVINNLGNSFQPFGDFLRWYLKMRGE